MLLPAVFLVTLMPQLVDLMHAVRWQEHPALFQQTA